MNTTKTAAVTYYPINEDTARLAKEANSYSDYVAGSATAEYRQSVDKAVEIAERQKSRVAPQYHKKIDNLLDAYARKLAENINNSYAIDCRVPSIMITGGSNFPVHKKDKQNAARDTNMRERQDIQGILEKIKSTGIGGISADDPNAIDKLQDKLELLKKNQETMKAVNAYYRKNKTLDGCPILSDATIEKLKASMDGDWRVNSKPYESYMLTNNNAEIRRLEGRINELIHRDEAVYVDWKFDGGTAEINQVDNRLQIFFDEKPDEETRAELKRNGFHWSPNAGAWQRQLNSNAFYAADRIKAIYPITGESPVQLQKDALAVRQQAEQSISDVRKPNKEDTEEGKINQEASSSCYNDLTTSDDNSVDNDDEKVTIVLAGETYVLAEKNPSLLDKLKAGKDKAERNKSENTHKNDEKRNEMRR